MRTQHVAAFFRRRWGRAAPRPGARAFACRVEVLEERFLLAQQATGVDWWSTLQKGTAGLTDQAALSSPSPDDDRTTLSTIEVFSGPGVASLFGPGTAPLADPTTGNSTVATAQNVPTSADSVVHGTVKSPGAPGVFRLTLNPNDRSLLIAFSWSNPANRIAGSFVLLNSSGQVVWTHRLPGKPFAIDLEFAHISANPGAALYLEILPAVTGIAAPAARSSDYMLQVMHFSEPLGFRQSVGSSWGHAVEILGFGPSSNQSHPPPPRPSPTPSPVSGGGTDQPTGVTLPLPQAVSPPVGGIFSQNDPNATSGVTVTAVADPDLLDLPLGRPGVPRVDIHGLLANVPYRADGEVADPLCATSDADLANTARPVALHDLGAWAVDQVLGAESQAEPEYVGEGSGLTLALPPVGIRALDHLLEESSNIGWAGDRAPLPSLVDEADLTERTCGKAEVTTAIDRPRSKRARALLPVLYSVACAIIGLSAPDLSASLRCAGQRRGSRPDVDSESA